MAKSSHKRLDPAQMSAETMGSVMQLQKKILLTIGLLLVYRFGSFVPIPAVSADHIKAFFEGGAGGLLDLADTFSGGALSRLSLFALSIFPYISASIVVQLLTAAVPTLKQYRKEGQSGKKKINQLTKYLTLLLAVFQSYFFAMTIEAEILNGGETVPEFFKLYFVASIVGGVFFLVWIGEKIKESGIGNGISLIIFVGIVATIIPSAVEFFELIWTGQFSEWQFVLVLLVLAVLLFVAVLFETASRKIPLQSSRVQAQGLQQAQESYLPIKVNISGVIAPIFASALLTLPSLVVSFLSEYAGDSDIIAQILASLGRGQPLYLLFYGALIMFFCFFYVGVVFDSNDVANNLKKSGVVLQGIRPGDATREFIDRVLFYLTVLASIYLLFICLVPEIANSYYGLPFYLGGTSILIIVSVVIDTFTQAQSYLFSKQYKKMIKKSGFGRR